MGNLNAPPSSLVPDSPNGAARRLLMGVEPDVKIRFDSAVMRLVTRYLILLAAVATGLFAEDFIGKVASSRTQSQEP